MTRFQKRHLETMSDAPALQLAEPQRAFIDRQVETGRYASPAEVVDAGLRLLEEREDERSMLHAELRRGLASGTPGEFDYDEFFAAKRAEREGR